MKKHIIFAATLTSALVLAGCDKTADAPAKSAPSTDMAGMEMGTVAKTGSGSGTITELDASAGKVTIAHGPIATVGWPEMTMGFKAEPKLLENLKVGDKVNFDLSVKGNAGEVTAIKKQ